MASPHILIIPYPAQGHLLPLLDFVRLLDLPITIATTPKNLPLLSPLPPNIQPLILPFPSNHSHDAENTKDLPPHLSPFIPFIRAISFLRSPILAWARSSVSLPTAIICDFFTGWAHNLARELNIPCYTFSPYSAYSLCIVHSLWHNMPKKRVVEDHGISFSSVPGSPVFLWHQLSTIYTRYRQGDPLSEFIRDCFLANFHGSGIILNTFSQLERDYVNHMRYICNDVWAVGPVNNYVRAAEPDAAGDLLTWLDGCDPGSVVYICFGSQIELSAAQAAALMAALERSGARFLWCVRSAGPAVVASERWFVLEGWAPQKTVLGHVAVGAYLTHCGFNSVLEAVAAGVAMLTWPMLTDQYMNERVVVEVAGVGVRVCEGLGTVPEVERVAAAVQEVMDEACGVRVRVRELSKKAAEAVDAGGSSATTLDAFVDRLKTCFRL